MCIGAVQTCITTVQVWLCTGLLVKIVSLSTQVLTYEKTHDDEGPGWQEGNIL